MNSLAKILPRGFWYYNGTTLGRTPDAAPWLVGITHGHYSRPKLIGRTFGSNGAFADKEITITSASEQTDRRHFVRANFTQHGMTFNQTIIIEKGNGPGDVFVWPRADLKLKPKTWDIYPQPRTVKINGATLSGCCVSALDDINRLGFLPAKLDMVSAVADAFAALDCFESIPKAINAVVNKFAGWNSPSLSSMVQGATRRRMEEIVQGELGTHRDGVVGQFWKAFAKAWDLDVDS